MAKTKKPKRGRAFRTGEPTTSMTIRLTATERDGYEAAAEAAELPLAEWIRQACAAHLKRG